MCSSPPPLLNTLSYWQKEELQVYQKYCQNKPRSEVLWRQCGDSLFFQVTHAHTHTFMTLLPPEKMFPL